MIGLRILTAEEISSLELQGTWLVTLSACQSARGESVAGEGVLGLRRGFFRAGAQNLLLTLWDVDDSQTADFMLDFYAAALRSQNAPKALFVTQRDWLKRLRTVEGIGKACRVAGPFIISSRGRLQ